MSFTTLSTKIVDSDMLVALIREYAANRPTGFFYNGTEHLIHVGYVDSIQAIARSQSSNSVQTYCHRCGDVWSISGLHDGLMILSFLTMGEGVTIDFVDSQMLIQKSCASPITRERNDSLGEAVSGVDSKSKNVPTLMGLITILSLLAAICTSFYAYRTKEMIVNGNYSQDAQAFQAEVAAFQSDIAELEKAERLGDVRIQILTVEPHGQEK